MTPSPDGRGAGAGNTEGEKPRGRNSRWWIVGIVVLLLAANLEIASNALQPNPPVRIPYSPNFLNQLNAGNVKEVNSVNNAMSGTLKKPIRYPAGDKNAPLTTNFESQIPSFASGNQLFEQLVKQGVVLSAKNPNSGPSVIESILFGFGPTLLLVGLFILLMRARRRWRRRRLDVVRPLAGSPGRGFGPAHHVRRRRRDR